MRHNQMKPSMMSVTIVSGMAFVTEKTTTDAD